MTNVRKSILSLFVLLFTSCSSLSKKSSESAEVKEKADLLQEAVSLTHKNGDSSKLYSAYQMLVNENGFDECLLKPFYIRNGIAVLTLLEKYEKLDCILRNEKNNIEPTFREDLIDANEYLQYKDSNPTRAIEAMSRIVKRYEKRLLANPNDSLIEQKLLLAKVYVVGKEVLLKQIDSMANLQQAKYSPYYYESLKNTINKIDLGGNTDDKLPNGNTESVIKESKVNYPKPSIEIEN